MHDVTIKVSNHKPKKNSSKEKIYDFFRRPTAGVLALLVIFALIPLTIYMAQQQQDLRQHADTYSGCILTAIGKSDGTVVATTQNGSNVKWYIYKTWDEAAQQWTDAPPQYIDQTSGTTYTYTGLATDKGYQLGAVIDNTTTCLGWVYIPAGGTGATIHTPDYFKNTSGKAIGKQLSQSTSGSTIYNVYGKATYYDAYVDDGSAIRWVEDRSDASANKADPSNFTLQTVTGESPIWLQDDMQLNVSIPTQHVTLTYRAQNACGSSGTAFIPYSTTIINDGPMTWPGIGSVDTIQVRYDYFGDYEFWWYAKGFGPVKWERHENAGGIRQHNGSQQTTYADTSGASIISPNCAAACTTTLQSACTFAAVPTATPKPGTPTATSAPGSPTSTPAPGTQTPTVTPGGPTLTPTPTPPPGKSYCGYNISGPSCTDASSCPSGDACLTNLCASPPPSPVICDGTTPTPTGGTGTVTPTVTGTPGKTPEGIACTVESKKVNVVFVGDSYTNDTDFNADVDRAKGAMLSVEPYKSNSGIFNFVTLANPKQALTCKNSSGQLNIVYPPAPPSCINDDNIKQTLVTQIQSQYPTLNMTPGYIKVVVLVNAKPDAIGNGGMTIGPELQFSVIQTQSNFEKSVIHEVDGHEIGSLYDRYVYSDHGPNAALIFKSKKYSNCTDDLSKVAFWSQVPGAQTPVKGCVYPGYYAPAPNTCLDPSSGTKDSVMSGAECWSPTVGFDATEQYWITNFVIKPNYTCNVGSSPTVTPGTGSGTPVQQSSKTTSQFQKVDTNTCTTVCEKESSGNVCVYSCPTPVPAQ